MEDEIKGKIALYVMYVCCIVLILVSIGISIEEQSVVYFGTMTPCIFVMFIALYGLDKSLKKY